MRLVLMGAPGVGKGSQAARLIERLGCIHVSTGDILRDAVQNGSSLGQRVRGILESGALVPDELIGELMGERLSRPDARAGFVLDGFPRTVTQVEILDAVLQGLGVELDLVFLLDVPEAEIVRRLSGRRVCPNPSCGRLYHIENRRPKSPGVCDACGSALVQRRDDAEDVIRERLKVYKEQTLPIARTYLEREQLREIDGMGAQEEVFGRIVAALENR